MSSSMRSTYADHASARGETRMRKGKMEGYWVIFYVVNKG